jgi:hypothetical protein
VLVEMDGNYREWTAEVGTLHDVAQELLFQTPKVPARLPRTLADRAVAAWQRDEEPGEVSQETDEQRSIRQMRRRWH